MSDKDERLFQASLSRTKGLFFIENFLDFYGKKKVLTWQHHRDANKGGCIVKKCYKFRVLLLIAAVLIASCSFGGQTIQASNKTTKTKAVYTIKKYNKKYSKSGGRVSAQYTYHLPQLKGSSKIVKKINTSLKKGYTMSLKDKKAVFEQAREANNSSYYTYNDQYLTTTKCKVTYNKKGYVSFCFLHEWYAGGVHNSWTDGMTYSLKTGKKLNVADVISGNSKTVKNKIIKKYFSKIKSEDEYARKELDSTKISKFQFYLKNGNVVVCFGPYQPGGGNGQSFITLKD